MAHDAGMDARSSLRLALRSTQNIFYTSHVEMVEQSVLGGSEIHAAMRKTGAFPEEFLSVLENGEESGQISEQMTRLSKDYRDRAQSSSNVIAMLAGVAVFGLVAIVIIFMIFRLAFFYLGVLTEASQPI